jgi:hypothetical protein
MRNGLLVALLGLVVVSLIVVGLPPGRAASPAQPRGRAPVVNAQPHDAGPAKVSGARGYLVALGQTDGAPLGRDREVFGELSRAQRIGDEYGQLALLVSGRLFSVPTGTPVVIVHTRGTEMSQVRILEGSKAGQTGWVMDSQIRVTTAARRD